MVCLPGVLDAPEYVPMGSAKKEDLVDRYGDVVVDDHIFYFVPRVQRQ